MSEETKVSIHELIKSDIGPKADGLIKEQKEGIAKLAKIMLDLGKAIEKPDAHMVKLLSKALDAESPLVANRLSRAGRLLERLDEAESEADLDSDLKEIEDITSKLSELENKLKHNYETVKEYQDKAAKALKQTADAEGDAAAEWAAYDAYLKKDLEWAKERLSDMQKLSADAQKAAASRDAKALKQAVQDGKEMKDAKPTNKELQDGMAKFRERVQPEKLSQELQEQFKRDSEKFQKLADEIMGINDQVAKIQGQIEKLDVEPADAKKVSALLKIPTQYDGKVKKALELDRAAAGKALEAIMKEAKIPMSAKDILAKLEKADLF